MDHLPDTQATPEASPLWVRRFLSSGAARARPAVAREILASFAVGGLEGSGANMARDELAPTSAPTAPTAALAVIVSTPVPGSPAHFVEAAGEDGYRVSEPPPTVGSTAGAGFTDPPAD